MLILSVALCYLDGRERYRLLCAVVDTVEAYNAACWVDGAGCGVDTLALALVGAKSAGVTL